VEDIVIWKNIKQGSKTALKHLHDKYFNQMCLFAFKSTEDSRMVEELVSDCFIKLWENRKTIEIKTSVKHYIFLMLRNGIIDNYRKKSFRTEPLTEIPDLGTQDVFDEQEQYAALYAAIEKLPQHCRRILKLAVFDLFSYDQIAEKLKISRNTVKTQMARAYRFLRENLNPKYFLFFYFTQIRETERE